RTPPIIIVRPHMTEHRSPFPQFRTMAVTQRTDRPLSSNRTLTESGGGGVILLEEVPAFLFLLPVEFPRACFRRASKRRTAQAVVDRAEFRASSRLRCRCRGVQHPWPLAGARQHPGPRMLHTPNAPCSRRISRSSPCRRNPSRCHSSVRRRSSHSLPRADNRASATRR